MRAVERLGDRATCGCPNSGCSPDVFINDLGAARVGIDAAGGRIAGPGGLGIYINGRRVSLAGDDVTPHGTGKHRSPKTCEAPSPDVFVGEEELVDDIPPLEEGVLLASNGPFLIAQADLFESAINVANRLCRLFAAFAHSYVSLPLTDFNVYDWFMNLIGVDVREICGSNATDEKIGQFLSILANLPFLAKALYASFMRLAAISATGAAATPQMLRAIQQFNALRALDSVRRAAAGVNRTTIAGIEVGGYNTNCTHCVLGYLSRKTASQVAHEVGIPEAGMGMNLRQFSESASKLGITLGEGKWFRGPTSLTDAYGYMLGNSRNKYYLIFTQEAKNIPSHVTLMERIADDIYVPVDPQGGGVGIHQVGIKDPTGPQGIVLIIPVKRLP